MVPAAGLAYLEVFLDSYGECERHDSAFVLEGSEPYFRLGPRLRFYTYYCVG
jgi:hypothetical protein